MRSLALALAGALLTLGAPTSAEACILANSWPNCPYPMDVTSIVCKETRTEDTPSTSTCTGHAGWQTPKTAVDVTGFIDLTFGERWSETEGIDITMWSYPGSSVLGVDTRDRDDEYITMRNVDTRLFPLMANRCVSAADPESLVFKVYAEVEARVNMWWQPIAWGLDLRISPDDFVNPPRCG